jgi:hypothetical protein
MSLVAHRKDAIECVRNEIEPGQTPRIGAGTVMLADKMVQPPSDDAARIDPAKDP